MPTPVTESSEGGQHVEWSEMIHAFLFRARIYLKRFGWIIIFTMLGGGLIQVWKTRDIPPVYRSQAEMMVGMQISSGANSAATVNEVTLNYFATQVHNFNLNAQLRKQAYDDAMALMPPGTPPPSVDSKVEYLSGTLILVLQAWGSNPDFTQHYLQALMEDFLEEKEQLRQQRLTEYGMQLKVVANNYEKDIQNLLAKRSEFVNKINLADLPGELDAANKRLHAFIETQLELETQLAKLRTRKVNQEISTIAPAPTSGSLTTPGNNDVITAQALDIPSPGDEVPLKSTDYFSDYINKGQNVETIDVEFAKVGLLPLDPEYQLKKDQTARTQALIDQLKNGGLADQHPKLLGKTGELNTLLSDLTVLRGQRVDKLEAQKANIEINLHDVHEQEKSLSSKLVEYGKMKDELDKLDNSIQLNKELYTRAIAGTAALPEASQMGQEMLTISNRASAATKDPQNTARQIGTGAVVGFAGGLIIVFLLGALDGRVMSVEDLSQRFEQPILGVIPMQKRIGGQVELLKSNDQRQQFAESCRNIRSSLLYMDRQGQRPRVIMLTSSMPSEGKSTLSANLSITLGFASSRTLLVDADMRRGQLHKRFGLKNDRGLAEHIQDGLSLDDVIQRTASENLDFISCGHYPMQPGELLMSERFRESIQTLRARYDFVIFDSPPILLTDDAASFATRADAVVFVVRAGYTRLRQVRTSLESLNRRGVNVYGMVVNFIDHREPGYYSYRYYDYYSYRPGRPA